eukprot:TRINITY_DN8724_c0_g1_i3.p2 TRINITY_DN8724_c0_g1~~TRINITY_DN8724_c0_g1_i3.p2  ORF type:complete len:318 (+),score=51.30 TRINITY_DN8724_c0_g1_i3:228-1181(+)
MTPAPPEPDPTCDRADLDEILPHVWLGSWRPASEAAVLRSCSISHVVNACAEADGPPLRWAGREYTVERWPDVPGRRLSIPARDEPSYDLSQHFSDVADFIDGVVDGGGSCLVHCRQGASRSATLVIAWMMRRHGLTAAAAESFALSRRQDVQPNSGFVEQLRVWERTCEGHRLRRAEVGRTMGLAAEPAKVRQTDFTAGKGNALQACVAAALGLELDAVPNFIELECGYEKGIAEFAASHGLKSRKLKPSELTAANAGQLCLVRGKSPRGDFGHVVVGRVRGGDGPGRCWCRSSARPAPRGQHAGPGRGVRLGDGV